MKWYGIEDWPIKGVTEWRSENGDVVWVKLIVVDEV